MDVLFCKTENFRQQAVTKSRLEPQRVLIRKWDIFAKSTIHVRFEALKIII